jgi:hypothetical protein
VNREVALFVACFADHSMPRSFEQSIQPIIMNTGKFGLVCLVTSLISTFAFAGPPFFTDDPEPVPFRHYEFYTFSTLDRAFGAYGATFPAFEFNVGAAPNLQLHVVAPIALSVAESGSSTYGIGDLELGTKYRFIQEKGPRPQIGVFPLIELPTGDSRRNLGNGRFWAKLPLWVQKSWGPWTSYGGAGYTINHAPGMRDHTFAGWQAQRELNKKLTLGAEWFDPGRESDAARNTQLIDAGGIYNITENFSLLFTGGHSVRGNSHTVGYLGLYWRWGPKDPADKSKLAKSMHSVCDRDGPLIVRRRQS